VTLKLQHHGQLEVVNGICHPGHVINGSNPMSEQPIHGFVYRGDPTSNNETFKILPVFLKALYLPEHYDSCLFLVF
jgi:hypothetical protein